MACCPTPAPADHGITTNDEGHTVTSVCRACGKRRRETSAYLDPARAMVVLEEVVADHVARYPRTRAYWARPEQMTLGGNPDG